MVKENLLYFVNLDLKTEKLSEEYRKQCELLQDFIKHDFDEKTWQDKIRKANPWGLPIKKDIDTAYPSLAKDDRAVLEPLLEANKEEFDSCCSDLILDSIFNDFEQAFDGNFVSPKVLFLGINPKMDYGRFGGVTNCSKYHLEPIYRDPFSREKEPPYHKHCIHKCDNSEVTPHDDDYYFGKNNRLYLKDAPCYLSEELRTQILSPGKVTPLAFLECFPYASQNIKTWDGKAPISKDIQNYIDMDYLLPSQIWLISLLIYTIKGAIARNSKLAIFLIKNNAKFRKNVLIPLANVILGGAIAKSGITFYGKINARSFDFTPKNVCNVDKDFTVSDNNAFTTDKDFFEKVWGIKLANVDL